MISIICPFFNEELILDKAINRMIANLSRLDEDYELILVNDGSIDNSLSIAEKEKKNIKNIKIVSYTKNMGRGFALKKGINFASGELIVTTEIDCSWGDEIVKELICELRSNLNLDIVIASPNFKNGKYLNIPFKRIFLSKLGNLIMRIFLSKKITMFTGMTRGYRAKAIKSLPISENGKEFHLDVIVKAYAFNLKFSEIPATLAWQDHKFINSSQKVRKSSTNINKTINSHVIFALTGQPFKYLLMLAFIFAVFALIALTIGLINYINGHHSIFLLIIFLSSLTISILLGGISILSLQNNNILKEIWISRKEIKNMKDN